MVLNVFYSTLSLESFHNLGSVRTVWDSLMAQMTALTAAPSWRALLPTQTLQSASALKA